LPSAVSVRLPGHLLKEIDQISKETERPRSFHIQKAIELYLEESADFQIALERLNDPLDKILSFEEMKAQFEM
jgi:RHH-type transcriptional regulator, rel operon repressor / antitoxin RelB